MPDAQLLQSLAMLMDHHCHSGAHSCFILTALAQAVFKLLSLDDQLLYLQVPILKLHISPCKLFKLFIAVSNLPI